MGAAFTQLAQQSGTSSAVSMYSPGASEEVVILNITICNTGVVARTFDIYIDNDGTTYTAATAKYYEQPIAPKQTIDKQVKWIMDDSAGNLAIKQDAGADLTFTVDGMVKT